MKKTILILSALFFTLTAAAGTSDIGSADGTNPSETFLYLTLAPGFCGEIDSYIIGDACVFKAQIKNTKEVITIYDNSSSENSDLVTTSDKHNLTENNNCFLGAVYKTVELTSQFGKDAYFTKILKRVSCR
ncbi:MAG: hypothetical protein A2622_07880 [Bdellovibrionales bacterium RIFCSPHIGHO2_01_FULL_40_29]|nr:MAG: hypothetical protein A2622_07880 [Bdellovibrionales bacterium RIFCSPHIGHO2_01_FULL_40_29]OFZ33725.1 MAG: hypothetical protein A3D17_09970 [Bdellovibrionales bacterium RIFCSPHIGHO2_02_FULL_40_15]